MQAANISTLSGTKLRQASFIWQVRDRLLRGRIAARLISHFHTLTEIQT